MFRAIAPATVVCLLLAVASCQRPQAPTPSASAARTEAPAPRTTTDEPAEPQTQEPDAEEPTDVPAEAPQVEATAEVGPSEAGIEQAGVDPNEVIIAFGDKHLTTEQVLWMEPRMPASALDQQLPRLANWWLDNELLYAEALERGLDKDPRVQFLADMMYKYAFQRELTRIVQEGPEVTEEQALEYYEKNRQTDPRLMRQGFLVFNHVRTATRQEADAAANRIKGGEDIKQVASQLSTHEDAERSGRAAGSYARIRERFGEKLFEALLKAPVEELVGPIEVDDDEYELAVLQRKVEPEPLSFEKVRDRIKGQLRRDQGKKAHQKLLDSLRQQAADKIVKSPRLLEIKQKPRPEVGTPSGQ